MPKKASGAPLRPDSVVDAIDALETKRKRKPSGLFPKPKAKPKDDLDLGSIR